MHNNLVHKQRGAALLVLFLIVFTVTSTVFLAGLNNNAPNLQREADIRKEMAQAKETLITYSMNYANFYPSTNKGPGRLPCPDSTNDGAEDCLSEVGRLPESITLGELGDSLFPLSNANAGIDRQLWYWVSPAFQNTTLQLNNTTTGGYTVDAQADDIVAVVIAPGEAFNWQDRISGPTSQTNYLEADNQSSGTFINSYVNDPDNFNDHVLGITREEILTFVNAKVTQEITSSLNNYYLTPLWRWNGAWSENNSYPRENWVWTESSGTVYHTLEDSLNHALSSAPAWIGTDAWDDLINYTYTSSASSSFSIDNCAINNTLESGLTSSQNPTSC